MSDPPVAASMVEDQPGELKSEEVAEGVVEEGKPELEHVVDGYIKVTEVLFNWTPFLNPWQANAVKALVNLTSLTHPDHPLREEGQDALRLYNCLRPEGYEMICFSLKQIEYLQFYIHEMRLADPAWTNYLAKLNSGNDEDKPKEGEVLEEPRYVEAENPWVPLPAGIMRESDMAEIEIISIHDPKEIKRMTNKQKKHNNQVDKQQLGKLDLTPEHRNRLEAEIDNAKAGPGLRRGPPRIYERRKERPGQEERPEGTGWGGFPTKGAGATEEVVKMEKPDHVAWQEDAKDADASEKKEYAEEVSPDASAAKTNGGDDQKKAPTTGPAAVEAPSEVQTAAAHQPIEQAKPETNGSTVNAPVPINGEVEEDDVDPRPDALAEQLNKIVDLKARIESEAPAGPAPSASDAEERETDPMRAYYFDAQQAFVLATAGGLASALAQKLKEDAAAGTAGEGSGEVPDVPAEIGRSLFFALQLTTWEEDENIVLEVGWAATWWQERLPAPIAAKDTKTDGGVDEESRFERMSENGHIIVQDHLLDKRNGKTKPDHRSSYNFGTSIPIAAKDVHRTLSQKLKELAKRAGGGPIYLLLHSTDGDESEFRKLGWNTKGWEKQIRPADWDYPSYASADGVGKVFLIDTAKLFGAIENDQTVLPAIGKTRKSLEIVAGTMFGADAAHALKACGNAGNYAAFCLQVFCGIVDGPHLEVLRADYQQSLVPIVVDPTPGAVDGDETDDAPSITPAPTSPLPTRPNAKVAPPALPTLPVEYVEAMSMKAASKVDASASSKPASANSSSKAQVNGNGNANGHANGPAGGEEEEDSEDEGIAGVYWEDRAGNIIELPE